ncbi:MAG: acyltransferase [bacterium]
MLKKLYWNFKDEIFRFNLHYSFLRRWPEPGGFWLRARAVSKRFESCGGNLTVNEGVRFRGIHRITAGKNLSIGVDAFIQASGGLTLGDNVVLGPGVKIWTTNHKFEDPSVPIREQGLAYEPVAIGDDVWLGANVFIYPGVQLPEGCVVAACSAVAKKRYPPYSILAGFPARVIGNRQQAKPEPAADSSEVGVS